MNFTNKIAAYFLLAIFLFNTMGYFIAFKAVQYQIKTTIISEIKLGISTDAETVITVNKNDLSKIDWKENGKEMVYNNKRYDIIKSNETQTSVTYYCINDKQEETLFSDLDEHINTHITANKPNNHTTKNLVNDVVKIFFTNQSQFFFTSEVATAAFYTTSVNYTSEYFKTDSPPPRFV